MRPLEGPREQAEAQRIESLRLAALVLIRAGGGSRVRTGNMAGRYCVMLRDFTISHYTPFNRPVRRRFRTERQRISAELWQRREFRYGLKISQGREGAADCLDVTWDREDYIFVHWFREDCQKPWDDRFLRYAKKHLRLL
jgi:hypothetical protein